jgi:hypothetical protein
MTVFANRMSPWFRVAMWLFVTTMFADASNFDDLFSDSVILHSDEEVTAQGSNHQADSFSAIGTLPVVRCLYSPHHPPAITILDQDSPSLAAERTMSEDVSLIFPQHDVALYHCIPFAGPLYLKFRVLLI